jgi:UDP-N-acetylmuramate dehydrogenase
MKAHLMKRSSESSFPSWAEPLSHLVDIDFGWHEPLARHTTFRIGGPVACLARPRTVQALADLLYALRQEAIPYFILGAGSNLLALDDPWQAVAVKLDGCCGSIYTWALEQAGRDHYLFAGSGVRLARLLRFCLDSSLAGLEQVVGIPGSVGGALIMNAGTRAGTITDPLAWITLLDEEGREVRLTKSSLAIGYRSVALPPETVLLGAGFHLQPCSAGELRKRLSQLMQLRRQSQPLGLPSAGCIFKNPPGLAAGALIDQAGLKGLKIGNAQVSTKHANWIVNLGGATAGDILALIEVVEERVHRQFGVELEREIRILGP